MQHSFGPSGFRSQSRTYGLFTSQLSQVLEDTVAIPRSNVLSPPLLSSPLLLLRKVSLYIHLQTGLRSVVPLAEGVAVWQGLVVQHDLELIMWSKLTLNSSSFSFYLPSFGITGLYHPDWRVLSYLARIFNV